MRKRMENPVLKSWDEVDATLKEEIKKLEAIIKEYVTENKGDLKGKSRELTFGRVGFRFSTKVSIPKNVEKLIKLLRKNEMDDCIIVKETVNKDVLRTYDEKDIIKVGASLKKEDTFWYETRKEESLTKDV